jgi:hypothetical protein
MSSDVGDAGPGRRGQDDQMTRCAAVRVELAIGEAAR